MDWRAVFKQHAEVCLDAEGTYFLYQGDYTPEEWVEISKVINEIEEELK